MKRKTEKINPESRLRRTLVTAVTIEVNKMKIKNISINNSINIRPNNVRPHLIVQDIDIT